MHAGSARRKAATAYRTAQTHSSMPQVGFENISYLRPRGHCDRSGYKLPSNITKIRDRKFITTNTKLCHMTLFRATLINWLFTMYFLVISLNVSAFTFWHFTLPSPKMFRLQNFLNISCNLRRSYALSMVVYIILIIQFHNIVTCKPVAWQRLGKHIPATTNTQPTFEYISLLFKALQIQQ
jgi:hypothetical protein